MEIQQLQRLKINSTNIKSSLIGYNKQLRKLRLDENKLLKDKEKKRELQEKEKKLETPGKGLIENIKSRIIAGPMSFFDKVKEFFGIVLIGLIINNLPAIVNKASEVGKTLIDVTSSIIDVIETTVNGINGFINIITSLPEATKNQLIKSKDELEKVILDLNSIVDPEGTKRIYEEHNKKLNSKSQGSGNSNGQNGKSGNDPQPQGKRRGGTIKKPASPLQSKSPKLSDPIKGQEDRKVTSSPYSKESGSPKLRKARQAYNAFGDFYTLSQENKLTNESFDETISQYESVNKSFETFLQEFVKLKQTKTSPPTPPTPTNSNSPPIVNGQTYTVPSGSGIPSQTEAYKGRGINPPQGANSHGYPARDYPVNSGLPISVFIPGEVVFTGAAGNYGSLVEIKHVTGQITRYAHLSQIKVKVGDKIEDGKSKLIGYSGGVPGAPGSGNSGGPHLHFEMLDPTGKTSMDYNTGDSFFRFSDAVNVQKQKSQKVSSNVLDPLSSSLASNTTQSSNLNFLTLNDDEEDDIQIVMINTVQQVIEQKTRTVMLNSGRRDPFPQSAQIPTLSGIWNA
jgi:murein DD-endopeptidase MepM/ murein hydrolase activator NlpD